MLQLCVVLYCNVLYCAVLYCAVMYCTVLYFTVQEKSSIAREVLHDTTWAS